MAFADFGDFLGLFSLRIQKITIPPLSAFKKCLRGFNIIFKPQKREWANVAEFVECNHAFFVRDFINRPPCDGEHIISMQYRIRHMP